MVKEFVVFRVHFVEWFVLFRVRCVKRVYPIEVSKHLLIESFYRIESPDPVVIRALNPVVHFPQFNMFIKHCFIKIINHI